MGLNTSETSCLVIAATTVDGVVGGALAEQVDSRMLWQPLLGMDFGATRSTTPTQRFQNHLEPVWDELRPQSIVWASNRLIHGGPT